jgi:hypothetical protein
MPAEKTLTKIRILNGIRLPIDLDRPKEGQRVPVATKAEGSFEQCEEKQRPEDQKRRTASDELPVFQGKARSTTKLKATAATVANSTLLRS